MSNAPTWSPFSAKNVHEIHELTLDSKNSWQGFNLNNKLQSDILQLAEIKQPKAPNLATDVFKLQLNDVLLEAFDIVDDSSSTSSQTQKDDIKPSDTLSEVDDDVWCAANLSHKSSNYRLLGWDLFQNGDTAIHRKTFLSEASKEVHDALESQAWQTEKKEPLKFVKEQQIYIALTNLLLGRSSLLFKWDHGNSRFEKSIEDFSLTGISPAFTSTLCDHFVAFGTNFRQLIEFCQGREKYVPTLHALQSAVLQILNAVEHHILTHEIPMRTITQLCTSMQSYSELVMLMMQVTRYAKSSTTEEQMITSIVTLIDEAWQTLHYLRPILSCLVVDIVEPAVQQTAKHIGLFSDRSGIPDSSNWLLSGLMPEYASIVVETVDCLASARKQCSLQVECTSYQKPCLALVHTWEELSDIQQIADDMEQQAMEMVRLARPYHPDPSPSMLALSSTTVDAFSLNTFEVDFSLPSSVPDLSSRPATSRSSTFKLTYDMLNDDPITFKTDLSPIQTLKMSLSPSISVQYRSSSYVLLKSLFLEHNLQSHVNVLHSFQLLGNGNFAVRLSRALFDASQNSAEGSRKTGLTAGLRLENREAWPPASSELRLVLMDLLSGSTIPNTCKSAVECMSFAIRDLSDEDLDMCRDVQSIHALDFLRLVYNPSNHILETVITNEALDGYDRIFKFLLVLLRTHALSQGMLMRIVSNDQRSLSMTTHHRFYLELHHFSSMLLDFALNTAVRVPWNHFAEHIHQVHLALLKDDYKKSVEIAQSISQLRKLHEGMIEEVLKALLLKKKQNKTYGLVQRLLSMILQVSSIPHSNVGELQVLIKQFRQIMQQLLNQITEISSSSQDPAMRRLGMLCLRLDYDSYYTAR